jgi:hypothetical protein
MPGISIEKLDLFLANNRIITSTFYVNDDMYCIMMEVYMTDTDETFIIRIPTKYKMKIGNGTNVFKVNEIDIKSDGTIIDRYVDNNTLKKNSEYDEIYIQTSRNNIESNIEESYNRPIDINVTLDNQSNEIYRQLKRLSKSILIIKYKLCIHTSNIMYFIDDSNNIRLFTIQTPSNLSHKFRKLSVFVSIDTLFSNISTVNLDIPDIYNNIVTNLLRNINKNIKYTIGRIPELLIKYKETTNKISEYRDRMSVLQKATKEINTNERKIIEDKSVIKERFKHSHNKMFTLNKDLEYTKKMRVLNEKLQHITETRKELFRNILSLRHKHNNLILRTDSSVFDITVLSETIDNKVKEILSIS